MTQPLFVTSVEGWHSNAALACKIFLEQTKLSPESRHVYATMWQALLADHGGDIRRISIPSIHRFFDSREGGPIHNEHRHRYRTLIRKVFEAYNEASGETYNPAHDLLRGVQMDGANVNRETPFLDDFEILDLKAYLDTPSSDWKSSRDKCLAALQLFAGLKPGECVHHQTTVECIQQREKTKTMGSGEVDTVNCNPTSGSPSYTISVKGKFARTPKLLGGEAAIEAWLSMRGQLKRPRPGAANMTSMFPGDRTNGRQMDSTTAYRAILALIHQTGISGASRGGERRLSGQTLRNTYAAMLIRSGMGYDEVMENLGIAAANSVTRLAARVHGFYGDGEPLAIGGAREDVA